MPLLNFRWLLAAVVVCSAAPLSAAPVFVRLVDAEYKLPLEYWQHTEDQPAVGHPMHFRMPTAVLVDGKAVPFTKLEKSAKEPGNKDSEDEDLAQELGLAAPTEQPARSDRAAEIEGSGGIKAQLAVELKDGEHMVVPGNVAFALHKGEIAADEKSSYAKAGPTALSLACYPVDLNLWTGAATEQKLNVRVKQGEHEIFAEQFGVKQALALRLFLPAGKEPYVVALGKSVQAAITVSPEGIKLAGAAAAPTGATVETERFTLGVALPVAAKNATATSTGAKSSAAKPELYLFTDRNRSAYAEGEKVEVSVRAFGPVGEKASVTFALKNGDKLLALPAAALVRCGASGRLGAAELALDTTLLRPGDYELSAVWSPAAGAKVASNVLPLSIAPLLPTTNMKLFGYSKWGSSSFEPKDLAAAARAGLNLVMQGGGGAQGGHVIAANASPFSDWYSASRTLDRERVRGAGPNVPTELQEAPVEHDAGSEFLLRHGIENIPIACPHILYFNVGDAWRRHGEDRLQAIAQLGQEWRRFPNFRGIVHTTGDGPTPATLGMVWAAGPGSFDIIHDERINKLREAFEFQVGKVEVDDTQAKAEFDRVNAQMQGALGFGVGLQPNVKLKGTEAAKLGWSNWINDLYPQAFRDEKQTLAKMIPDPTMLCAQTWGPGAGGGMWPETFGQPLDHIINDIHGDYGIMPLSYSTGNDLINVGNPRRAWIGLDLIPERTLANGVKLLLEALSRNPDGIGSLNLGATQVAGGWAYEKSSSEALTIVMDIARRYGEVFRHLERRDEIAVIASMRQDTLAGQSWTAMWGAHFLASKAGYQANFITEEQLEREPNTLNGYKAVFLVQMTAGLSPTLAERLAKFQKAGGVVVADKASKSDLANIVRVETTDMLITNQVDFRIAYSKFTELIPAFRAKLSKLESFAKTSSPDVHLVRSVDGDLEYWTVFNDTMLSAEEYPGSGHFIQFLYKGLEAELAVAQRGIVYDALRREQVETQTAKSGMQWKLDCRNMPGTVYVCAPSPIAHLAVQHAAAAVLGSAFSISATAEYANGKPVVGRLPIELVIRDPAGVERYRLYRTTNTPLSLKLAINDPAGDWRWTVVEQATGLASEGVIKVEAAAKSLPAVTLAPAELVYDAPAVADALANRELDIVLYPQQQALRPAADRLAKELVAAGVKAQVRIFWPTMQRNFPMNWKEFTIEDEEIEDRVAAGQTLGVRVRGKNQFGTGRSDLKTTSFYAQYTGSAEMVFDRDVILLGHGDADQGPLLAHIATRCRMLPRNPSPSFPAPGMGLVGYAWSPFSYQHDAIVVYGQDDAGLAVATASLVKLATTKANLQPPVWNRAEKGDGEIYADLGLVPPKNAKPQIVRSEKRTGGGVLPVGYSQRISAARVADGKLLAKITPQVDALGPVFAEIDLKAGQATRFNVTNPAIRTSSLDQFARRTKELWPAERIVHTGDERILPLAAGIVRLGANGEIRWKYDPFPTPTTLDEARYPRRCQQLVLSADGTTLAACFYDLGSGGGYGPKYRSFHPGVVVLLDAASGKERARIDGSMANELHIAADGSRVLVVDNLFWEQGRGIPNPLGVATVAVYDAKGKLLLQADGAAAQGIAVSKNLKLAVVQYNDPRGAVALVDVDRAKVHNITYNRMDLGAACAGDGSFATITYADGLVRQVAPDGEIMLEKKTPAPGIPAVLDDGAIAVVADDGRVYLPASDSKSFDWSDAAIEKLPEHIEAAPAGLVWPSSPHWQSLPKDAAPSEVAWKAPAELASFSGEQRVQLELPQTGPLDITLLMFTYQLAKPEDTLRITAAADGATLTYLYPYEAHSRTVAVPLRVPKGGKATITFAADGGVALTGTSLAVQKLGAMNNLSRTDLQNPGPNPQAPSIQVPNIHGFLGDPRVEQMARGFPEKGDFPLPPDVTERKTDPFSYFDGNVHTGTPLYPTSRPGYAPWDPPSALPTLRSAQIIMDFARPIAVNGLGVWEHPHDRPVSAFALEMRLEGPAAANSEPADEKGERWKLVLVGQGNLDYYHLHRLREPVTAKTWRYTVLDTPSVIQRIAEIELYSSSLDSLLDGGGLEK